MAKLSRPKALEMGEFAITRHVFRGASPSEARGLRERLTDPAIVALVMEHSERATFSQGFRTWLWAAIDSINAEDDARR